MKKLILLSLVIAITLFNCSEDDAPPAAAPDETKPTITIIAPTDLTNPLRATVTVKAEATDDTGIAKVEVFVDGTSIASAISSPVEASWDTKTVTDGSHVIKIVAEDAEGNKEEKSLTVEVKNILFTFTVDPFYLSEFSKGWIFISDDNGKTIGAKEIINGTVITFDTPEGFTNNKKFTFTRLDYYFEDFDFGSNTNVYLASYISVEPGDLALTYLKRTTNLTVGSHTLFIENIPVNYLLTGLISLNAKRGDYSGSFPITTIPVSASLTKSPADIIYYTMNDEDESLDKNNSPLTYRNTNAMAGDEETVDYSMLEPMDFLTFNFEGAISSGYSLNYIPTVGDYANIVYLYDQRNTVNPNVLKVYVPEITFPEYLINLDRNGEGGRFRYERVSTQLSTQFKMLNAMTTSFDNSEGKISIETTGSFTYVNTDAFSFEIDEANPSSSTVYDWIVVAPQGSKVDIQLPEIPQEILFKYPNLKRDFVFESTTLFESVGVSNYNDWVKLRFSNKSIYSQTKERLSRTQLFVAPGGRLGKPSDKYHPRIDDFQYEFRQRK